MATSFRYRAIVIAPSVYKNALNQAVENHLDSSGGSETFTLGASATGANPASHVYANSAFTAGGVKSVKALADSFPLAHAHIWVSSRFGKQSVLDGLCSLMDNMTAYDEPQNIDELLSEMGLQRIDPLG